MPITLACTAVAAIISTRDINSSIAWYSAWLGDPDLRPTPDVAEWVITPTAWLQVTVDEVTAGHGAAMLGVPDMAEALTLLRSMDVDVSGPHTIPDVVTFARFEDPDGNSLTLAQEA